MRVPDPTTPPEVPRPAGHRPVVSLVCPFAGAAARSAGSTGSSGSADSSELLAATREIFREYASGLGIDLGFQNFDAELAGLPGDYAPPAGHLLLAFVDGALAGCGALRPIANVDHPNACEMKRLYVRPAFRRFGLGRALGRALLDEARRAGYSAMLLDTLDDMKPARELYETLGFQEIAPYCFNPIAGAHYLKAGLG